MSQNEIAIVGGGLGGISAAVYLKLAGFDVCLFEKNERVGGRANRLERDGFLFDTGPSLLNYPWVFQDFFAAAGKRLEDYVELLPVDPALIFRWSDRKELILSSDVTRLRESLYRLEPECDAGLMAFLRDAQIKYKLAFEKLVSKNVTSPLNWLVALTPREMSYVTVWRSLYSELGRFFRSRYIKEALGAYAMYLGGSPFELPGFFSILSYGELAYGLWLPKRGIYGLVEGMERLANELGVVIRTQTPVVAIETSQGRVRGLRLADGSLEQFPIVVSNVDVPYTDTFLLNGHKNFPKLQKRAKRMKMTPGVCTFYWGLKTPLHNLAHHTIFLPDNYKKTFDELMHEGKIPSDIPFYVSVPSATDRSLAPPGGACVFVLIPTPRLSQLGDVDWSVIRQDLRQRVLKRLEEEHYALDPDSIVVEEFFSVEEWHRRYGLYDGSAFGAAHTLFQVGPFRAGNQSAQIKGLYYTGASTTPGTGLPMVVLSGKLTAERVVANVR